MIVPPIGLVVDLLGQRARHVPDGLTGVPLQELG